MFVFFPKFLPSSVEQGYYSGCLTETGVKVTCDVWQKKDVAFFNLPKVIFYLLCYFDHSDAGKITN